MSLNSEDLISSPIGSVELAIRKINIPLPVCSGILPDFESLKAAIPSFFRKGETGNWKSEMPANLEETFWSIHGPTMSLMGYTR